MHGTLSRLLTGILVCTAAAAIGASTVGANRGADRTISLYNIHTKETVTVAYKRDGKFVPAAMERINWVLRDWRKNEPTTMDPELVDLLWEMHNELGSSEPIHIISGYRSRSTNSMLKKTRGGQAEKSQHINGKAADVHFPDVPIQRLRYSALVRERGGVGYYPLSAIPFVHVDTARVRAWPRLPRQELALLFPSGRTEHMPADGGPLTAEDGRAARSRLASAGGEIGAFLNLRRGGGAKTIVAEARPAVAKPVSLRSAETARRPEQSAWQQQASAPAPTAIRALAETPRLVAAGPSSQDRAQLHNLTRHAAMMPEPRLLAPPRPAARPPTIASLAADALGSERHATAPGHQVAALDAAGWTTPTSSQTSAQPQRVPNGRFGWGETGQELRWMAATEFDDEHPDELSYRPFPIAPLLTDRADEPLLADFVKPDVTRSLEMIDQPVSGLPLHFRPTPHVAASMWSQQFKGSAVGLNRLHAPAESDTGPTRPRAVKTSSR